MDVTYNSLYMSKWGSTHNGSNRASYPCQIFFWRRPDSPASTMVQPSVRYFSESITVGLQRTTALPFVLWSNNRYLTGRIDRKRGRFCSLTTAIVTEKLFRPSRLVVRLDRDWHRRSGLDPTATGPPEV